MRYEYIKRKMHFHKT